VENQTERVIDFVEVECGFLNGDRYADGSGVMLRSIKPGQIVWDEVGGNGFLGLDRVECGVARVQ
jgi:hypothetical protein